MPALVQERRKRIETGLGGSGVNHRIRIDAPAAASPPYRDFFVAFSPPSRFFSSDLIVQAQTLNAISQGWDGAPPIRAKQRIGLVQLAYAAGAGRSSDGLDHQPVDVAP
jgi:hypothetical protein